LLCGRLFVAVNQTVVVFLLIARGRLRVADPELALGVPQRRAAVWVAAVSIRPACFREPS
jgi:hypothetical protein